jgi:hypothetical protein
MGAVAERGAGIARAPMPVHGVLFEAVVRREIETAAEPPDRRISVRDEEAHVGVRRRRIRVARVNDQRDRRGFVAAPGELGPPLRRRRRQRLADRVRKVHRGLLDHRAALEHAGPRDAAGRRLEALLAEARAAILGFQRRADPILEILQVRANGSDRDVVAHAAS